MRISPLALCLAFLPLGACTVGPDYARPKVGGADAGEWVQPGAKLSDVELEPWRALGDPLLVELIERAGIANLDLRQAEARLREARAGRDAAVGRTLPQLAAGGSATEQQLSENGQLPIKSIPSFDRRFSLFDGGFDASWEIDLWGGGRRAVEAATRRIEAADAQRREVRLQAVAEVARTYAELRGAQAQAAELRAEAQAQRDIARLVRQRFDAGEASRFDDVRAEAQARGAEAALPGAEARIRASAYALALLTAQSPEALADRLLAPAPLPKPPELVAAGLRADMLRRRPDVAAAEANLAAATADIGVETANLFPRISLLGSIGQQSRRTEDFTAGGSTRFSIGPSFHWPIFAGGTIRAQIRAADARAEGAAAAYEKAVLGALADSETALNAYGAALAALRDLEIARDRSATALSLAQQRYRAGEDDLILLLDTTSRFNAADRAANDARVEALRAHARLVKALGGGWKEEDAES